MASATSNEKFLHVSVISPAKAVFKGDARSVVVPAFDGELGVLPGHAAFLSLLGTGELRVSTAEGETRRLAVRGGFLQVNEDNVTVLTPESAASTDINVADLRKEEAATDSTHPTQREDRESLDARRKWLKVRQKIAGS